MLRKIYQPANIRFKEVKLRQSCFIEFINYQVLSCDFIKLNITKTFRLIYTLQRYFQILSMSKFVFSLKKSHKRTPVTRYVHTKIVDFLRFSYLKCLHFKKHKKLIYILL